VGKDMRDKSGDGETLSLIRTDLARGCTQNAALILTIIPYLTLLY
jgi:hypothetical protein